ncbi:hypothetical protein H8F46_01820 [Xenorhabdus nematophila]|uniref:hypothetical protein n=1 Tax=Xenorhabdus nematophila TaxID=628 RepID=UPI00164CC9F2|nr:hypothetical protein [Xenorhabdus nematophila]QNJ37028.1 hypothetical protein H8F46_01820 [Xenorhabdus nematophila]
MSDSKILIVPFSTFIERLKGFRENNKEIPIPFFIKEYLDHGNIELDKIHLHLWAESAKIKCEKTTTILTQGGIVEKEISADMIVNYLYQSPLKMLDFLSKPNHACHPENSSDPRPKMPPRIDAQYNA